MRFEIYHRYLIPIYILSLSACSQVGLEPVEQIPNVSSNDSGGGDDSDKTPPDDNPDDNGEVPPQDLDTIAPMITFTSPILNLRVNYSNFSAVRAAGNCDEKSGLVSLSAGGQSIGEAICDGEHWEIPVLPDLSFLPSGNFSLKAEIKDKAGNIGRTERAMIRAPQDRTASLLVSGSTRIVRNKLKIFLIVDDSSSMAEEQDRLSKGITKLADSLRQYDVTFYIYSTSISKTIVGSNIYRWVDPVSGLTKESTAAPTAVASYLRIYQNSLRSPSKTIGFTAGMSEVDFTTQKNLLSQGVKAVGITGSANEAGFLNMAHILTSSDFDVRFMIPADSASRPDSDKAVFLILSDSDDRSAAESTDSRAVSIESRYTKTQKSQWVAATLADAVGQTAQYKVSAARVRFQSNGLCSGDPCLKTTDYYYSADPAKYGNVATVCNAQLLAELAAIGVKDFMSCNYEVHFGRSVSVEAVNPSNICNAPFASNGVSFSDVYDFQRRTKTSGYQDPRGVNYFPVSGSCSVSYYKWGIVDSWSSAVEKYNSIESVLSSGSATKLSDALKVKLQQRFGNKGYFVSAIINRTDMGSVECQNLAEGNGTAYLDFIQSLTDLGYSNTICSEDYSPALASIKDFAERVVNRSFDISLGAGESVYQAVVVRTGIIIPLSSSDYVVSGSESGKTIQFLGTAVREGDVINLKIHSL